ncbi:MAG: phosphoribosyltransferase [Thiobacillus sp. SCN 63-1177]|nr:MAG: phosphoribosyltransferase [Thiobacillus sp. SCN 63-1177]
MPRACLLCGAAAGNRHLCGACLADLPWHSQPQCPHCATPTPAGQVCGACLKHPPAFDRSFAALAYAFPLDRLMPLHAQRIRERGFNHATEIARETARRLRLPLDVASCRRIRDTPPQMGLKHAARQRNVRGAFTCSDGVRGLHIALIDDVMTTGTSFDELAATLKRAGAREVSCWAAARTLPPP